MTLHWICDLTSWGYIIIGLMCLWNIAICIEYHLVGRRRRSSPFFYYVMLMLLGIFVSNVANFYSRFHNDIVWTTAVEYGRIHGMLTSLWWAARLLPLVASVGVVTVDFTMRRFLGKRLLDELYDHGSSEEQSREEGKS